MMIYYTNKARETAKANIARLIPVLASVPGNVISYSDVHEIIGYLQALDNELDCEIRAEAKRERNERS